MKLNNLIFLNNPTHLTQIYIENVDIEEDEFFVPIGKHLVVGYLLFKRAEKAAFALESLIQADYPNPHPQLLLSGVLYSRQEALEAQRSLIAYQQGLN